MAESNQVAIKENTTFKWQFSLEDKQFDCDPKLPSFIGFPNKVKISIGQLFSRFDKRQSVEITEAFKNVLATQKDFNTNVIVDLPNHKYLMNLSIYPSKSNVVTGELCYLQPFPTKLQENEFLKVIFDGADSARMLASSDHKILMVNKKFCEETGFQEHELIGKSAQILKSGHYEPAFYKGLWETVNTAKIWRGELLAATKDKQVYSREVQIKRIDVSPSEHFYYSNSIKLDIPSSLLHSQLLDNSSAINVPDKAKYTNLLNNTYKELSSEETIVVASFSIKWMQKVSESTACWLVSQRFNQTKQLGTLGLVSKDIYSIYWIEEKNPDQIDSLLRKLLTAFSHGYDDAGLDLFSTVNLGVSILSVDAKNPMQLISHSIQTLIANPEHEYSSLYYFDRRLAKRFDRHHVLAKLLRESLNAKKVEVYYQPVVEIPAMQIGEFEALFRIKLETELDYNTQELINIAETYNWIDEIDAMVTQIALAELPLIQQHFGNDKIGVGINRSLCNDRISHCCLEDTIDILVASGADLNNVTIELTESAIFENFDHQKQWVEALQKLGVKIAIDDFGTGYSSFAYLNNLPVDFIKIDRAFVTGLTLESNEYAMIEMLCKLAHKIGAQVIAEGVETPEEFKLLSRAKVDLLQGYIFSKPVSLTALLASSAQPYPLEFSDYNYSKRIASVADIYAQEYKVAEFDERLSDIKEKLSTDMWDFFIVLENKKCHGILYSSDYYASISPHIGTKSEQQRDLHTLDKRVHQVMRKNVMTLCIDSEISAVETFFIDHPHDIIIINNHAGECIGFVTVQLLLSYKLASNNPSDSNIQHGEFI